MGYSRETLSHPRIIKISDPTHMMSMVDHVSIDIYYVAYKLIILPCISFVFLEIKFIHCHYCVML